MAEHEQWTYMAQIADTIQLTLSGTAASTAVAPAGTAAARIYAIDAAWVRTGAGATAAANTALPLAAGQVEYLRVKPGERVSALQFGTGGTVHVTWMG